MGQTLVCGEERSCHARAISVRRPPGEMPSSKDIHPCEPTMVRPPGEPISTKDTSPGGKCLGKWAYRDAPPGDGEQVLRVRSPCTSTHRTAITNQTRATCRRG